MILKTEILKDVSQKILSSVDAKSVSTLTEIVELNTIDDYLYFNITNQEYYVSVKFKMDSPETLHAAVNANLFLKLIDKTTTPNIELSVIDNTLVVKGNGEYKIPMNADGEGNLGFLPTIELNNVVAEMDIPAETLNSLITYNSKEIQTKIISKPVQQMYYIDEQGCITFTQGACVNNFTLT